MRARGTASDATSSSAVTRDGTMMRRARRIACFSMARVTRLQVRAAEADIEPTSTSGRYHSR
jgi:hypothetical protein